MVPVFFVGAIVVGAVTPTGPMLVNGWAARSVDVVDVAAAACAVTVLAAWANPAPGPGPAIPTLPVVVAGAVTVVVATAAAAIETGAFSIPGSTKWAT